MVGLKQVDTIIKAGYNTKPFNRTMVGLKPISPGQAEIRPRAFNRTMVGLKLNLVYSIGLSYASPFNRTMVGLKHNQNKMIKTR